MSCGTVPRQLTFTQNDWEPAIHARNLVLLQLILESRSLLGSVETEMVLVGRMGTMGVGDRAGTSAQDGQNTVEAAREGKVNVNPGTGSNTTASSRAGSAGSEGLDEVQEGNAAFSQRIGVIFSAMYNVFVDAEVLNTTQDVAGRLAASLASSEEWNLTELGRLVHFTDDRSQYRVRDILTLYADTGLQKRVSVPSVKKQRSASISKRLPQKFDILSRSMGLSSLGQDHNSYQAHNEMVRTCKINHKTKLLETV